MVREKEAGMSAKGQVSIDLDLAFAAAGVGFAVQVRDGSAETGAALQIVLRALDDNRTARFTPECSHALSDFVGGFCRWLGTKGVTVAHTEQEVSGHFHAQHDVPQVLAIVEELCQMLEDKFGAYPYAIVS
jgi:hypothetical protein